MTQNPSASAGRSDSWEAPWFVKASKKKREKRVFPVYGCSRAYTSCVIVCSICAGHARDTLFDRNFPPFLEKCTPLKQETWFSISCLSILHQISHFLDPQNDGRKAIFGILFVATAPLLARITFFRAKSAIWAFRGAAKSSTKMCISCLRAPWAGLFSNS